MHPFLRIPKVQLALTLSLIYITVLIKYPNPKTFYIFLTCVGFMIFFDLLFTFLRKQVLFIPYAAIVTGLILTLIIDTQANILQIAAISALAMVIKNFARVFGRHIFNPLASGLFVGGLIFNQYTSWWGVSFQNITQSNLENIPFFLILLSPATVSIFRFKKHYAMLAFIITNTLITYFFHQFISFESIVNKMLDPSLVFFTLVMLPEPMTSPVNTKMQVLYGILVGTVPFIFSNPFITGFLTTNNLAFDPLLFSLLLGNLIFFKNR